MGKALRTLSILIVCAGAPGAARAADSTYEPGLMRVAEVLGSLHFLRNLCGEKGDRFRLQMEKLMNAEKPEPERRARFVANFNRGYRAFESNYTSCTASANEAIKRYMKEGETLTRELASRFGN